MKSYYKAFLTLVLQLGFIVSHGQKLNESWNKDLATSLQQFLDCENTASTNSECSKFIGQSLKDVYKLNDFYSVKLGRNLTVSEIANFLQGSDQWKMLGRGYDQKALADAQSHANARKAVVAVYLNSDGIGHIAIILPGELQPSGSWGLNVPNSASFLLMEPQRSYVNKGLSYAFAKNHLKDVVLYVRSY